MKGALYIVNCYSNALTSFLIILNCSLLTQLHCTNRTPQFNLFHSTLQPFAPRWDQSGPFLLAMSPTTFHHHSLPLTVTQTGRLNSWKKLKEKGRRKMKEPGKYAACQIKFNFSRRNRKRKLCLSFVSDTLPKFWKAVRPHSFAPPPPRAGACSV